MATPSTKNRTFSTATSSEAAAVRVTEPERWSSFEGAMKATDGEIASRLAVDSPTETVTRIIELPVAY